MRFVQIVLFLLLNVVVANGGKVSWGADGKRIIEASGHPIHGYHKQGLDFIIKDNNDSNCS